ncbi:MAG: sterol desaturase family protein, partial [Pseudomonadota bacterium]
QSTHPVFSHSGFEKLVVNDSPQLRMGVYFHQLHHRYFECNYGNAEMPWDRWFGTYHDGSETALRTILKRKQKMHANAD